MLIRMNSKNEPTTIGSAERALHVRLVDDRVEGLGEDLQFDYNTKTCILTLLADESCYIQSFGLNPYRVVQVSPHYANGEFPAETSIVTITFTFADLDMDQTHLTVDLKSRSDGKIFSSDPQVGNDPVIQP